MSRYDVLSGSSFLLALGIVGSVENGAPLRLMLLALAFVGIMGIGILLGNAARN